MALLELSGVSREYPGGEGPFLALKRLDLAIEAGDSVAIVGASGSGKSTLMNILGCLDRPSAGAYRVAGQNTAMLGPDALAALRREWFGFIFQRYNLLADLTALANVEVPAVYAGVGREARHERARALLDRLGLAHRLAHRPYQLSGGQQQRVSIARALMNGGQIILADEPTGALDSHSGEGVLRLLQELRAEGHTLILVTHDRVVAEHADRIIELRDGEVVSDRREHAVRRIVARPSAQYTDRAAAMAARTSVPAPARAALELCGAGDGTVEALRMALLTMKAHRTRTFLTMLGIIIGIASLVLVVALGEGGREQVLAEIRSIGTNTVDVVPGHDWGDVQAEAIHTLNTYDAIALQGQSYVDSVTPTVTTSEILRAGNVAVSGSVIGVGEQYFRVHGVELAAGRVFSAEEARAIAQVVVIDEHTRLRLFGSGSDPLGRVIFLGAVPCRVIGMTRGQGNEFGDSPRLHVWVPYTTALGRVLGSSQLQGITARIADSVSTTLAAQSIEKLLTQRHGKKDFFIDNSDAIRRSVENSTRALTILISSIAFISLIVGGIGVMNIMLVSVTERTREIGVRAAVGARRSDILRQFLIEAVLVCLFGGAFGILIALSAGWLFTKLIGAFPLVFSTTSMAFAAGASILMGVLFGYLPARSAARLDPIEALARE